MDVEEDWLMRTVSEYVRLYDLYLDITKPSDYSPEEGEEQKVENRLQEVEEEYRTRIEDGVSYTEQIRAILDVSEEQVWPRAMAELIGCSPGHARRLTWDEEAQKVVEKSWSVQRRENQVNPHLRQTIRERDRVCVVCGGEEKTTVHHIIPATEGGEACEENLALLCGTCHKKAHAGSPQTASVVYESRREFWRWVENPSESPSQSTLEEF